MVLEAGIATCNSSLYNIACLKPSVGFVKRQLLHPFQRNLLKDVKSYLRSLSLSSTFAHHFIK